MLVSYAHVCTVEIVYTRDSKVWPLRIISISYTTGREYRRE